MEKTATEITAGIVEMLGRIEELLKANRFPPVHGEMLLQYMKAQVQSLLSEYCFDLVCPAVFIKTNEQGSDYAYDVRFVSESDSFFWSLIKVSTSGGSIVT